MSHVDPGTHTKHGRNNAPKGANDVALAYVAQRLQHGMFNGQIVLHVNSGVIRKTEVRDVVTTEALLTGKATTG